MEAALPGLIRFGREICGDLAEAERREWWLANGLGAYAAGTIAGTLTRRYHGLLVAPVNPPLGRHLVLAKADATLSDGTRSWDLATNRWSGGTLAPKGYLNIESFRLEGRVPVWSYACGELRIEHRIWMEYGENTTYAAWRLVAGGSSVPLKLSVKLLVNARDFHSNARPWDFNPMIERQGAHMRVAHPNWFTLHLKARGGEIESRHDWYENFDLPMERERGLGGTDCHLCVGEAKLSLFDGQWAGVVASLNPDASIYLDEAYRRAQSHDMGQVRRAQVQVPQLLDAPAWIGQLVLAADSFIFKRPAPGVPDGESVIAGFPWFGDWGRDTMIALPGLTLAVGRYETARRILTTFAKFVDQGMLPNVFPGSGNVPEYNTVDAALWYVEAWRAYVQATGDVQSLKQAFEVLQSIIEWHVKGTRYGIGLDESDGLLHAGEEGVQLTWMDAKVGDWVVTPRMGKPVEINALWFNAVSAMAEFCERLNKPAKLYRDLAKRAQDGFARFVNPASGALYDVIDAPWGDDATLRPNQIFAVSLPFSPLDAKTKRRVVEVVGRDLLTSYGLRSLDPAHRDYRPQYTGGVWERDCSYHQGPVWAFLLGHYAMAEYRVTGDAAAAQARLEPIRDHLLDAGLGTVSEIFDGAPPHTPRGTPSQAWSVSCTLEAWWMLECEKQRARPAKPVTSKKSAVAV
ncbi:MAG: amylo-alpha-1,6-glucosidase [Burkholderiales bacterium]